MGFGRSLAVGSYSISQSAGETSKILYLQNLAIDRTPRSVLTHANDGEDNAADDADEPDEQHVGQLAVEGERQQPRQQTRRARQQPRKGLPLHAALPLLLRGPLIVLLRRDRYDMVKIQPWGYIMFNITYREV